MKYKLILTLITIGIPLSGSAQTNTFPTSGNVGIGTTNPQQTLEVDGFVRAKGFQATHTQSFYNERNDSFLSISGGSSKSQGAWIIAYGPNAGAGHASDLDFVSQDVQFQVGKETNQIYAMTLDEFGRVGVGTTSPQYQLDISSSEYPLRLNRDNPSYGVGIVIQRQGNDQWTISGGASPGADNFGLKNSNGDYHFSVSQSGRVGIGTLAPSHELDVIGTIRAHEIIVSTEGADFVFEEGYNLRSLSEVETHIQENGHLPDIPSAQIMQDQGVSISELQTKLLQKIEELTLYMIEKDKQIEVLQARVAELETN